MRKFYSIVVCLLIVGHISLGNVINSSDKVENKHLNKLLNAKKKRSFSKLKTSKKVSLDNFLPEGPVFTPENSDTLNTLINYIIALEAEVENKGSFVDQLLPQDLLELPIGISRTIGNLRYTVLIDQVRFFQDYAEIDVYMSFLLPNNNKRLTFAGRGVRISKEGGLTGEGRLEMIGDFTLNEGSQTQIVIKGGNITQSATEIVSPTYALFDCNGFKEMGLAADVIFSKNLVVPEDPATGQRIENESVTANFSVTLADWNDFVANINLPPFQFANLNGVGFTVSNVVVDLSDTRNSENVTFPDNYLATYMGDGAPELWRGVYMKEVSVRLPRDFKDKDRGDDRLGFSGEGLLIDQHGFTGLLSANNLIPIDKGKIAGWSFSIQQLQIGLEASNLVQAGINGQVHVPITSEKENGDKGYFSYSARFQRNGDFRFLVSLDSATQDSSGLNFDLWKAKVYLYNNSSIEISRTEGELLARAILHGKMDINASLKDNPTPNDKKGLKLSAIEFQALQIQNRAPILSVEAFSLGFEGERSETAKFPVSIHEIFGSSQGGDISIGVDMSLHLTNSEDGGFSARGRIAIKGGPREDSNGFRFKGVTIDRFAIDVSKGPLEFSGSLAIFKEDPQFGNGINGQVSAKFGISGGQGSAGIAATAIFGNVNGMRYWYVDALAEFSPALGSGLVNIKGFGGGAYYRMSQLANGNGSPLGATQSGLFYQPDSTAGLGVKATVVMTAIKDNILEADATFEIAFRRGGGLKHISFLGNAYLLSRGTAGGETLKSKAGTMATVANQNKSATNPGGDFTDATDPEAFSRSIFGDVTAKGAPISAHILMRFDFENRTFHANIEAYLNVAGGLLKGTGPNGRAGRIVMHFAPDEWYIYIGRPEYENRVGVSFGLGPVRVSTTAYFVMGTTIPGSPPPPSEVSEILGGIDLDYTSDLNRLGNGGGVGFGLDFRFDTGDLRFLIFYARFAMGMGFDAMLKDYGDAHCAGSSDRIGVNGWYANAQIYAYIQGEIGITFKLFRKRRKITILSIGLAAILQARLPNPFWMRGIVGGRFRVLGGLIKGRCRFQIELGDKCEIVRDDSSILDGVEAISQLTPDEGTPEVDVFTVPQAVFNLAVEREFQMVDVDNSVRRFKISIEKAEVRNNGAVIESELRWNEDHTVLGFVTDEVLPPESNLQFEVTVAFNERKASGWEKVQSDGEDLLESKLVNFTTGSAPDYIPKSNVAHAFPVDNQLNYYQNEYRNGHVKLIRGQSYLFEDNDTWDFKGRVGTEGNPKYFDFSYTRSDKELTYTIPTGLTKGAFHKIEMVAVPKGALGDIAQNVDTVSTNVDLGNEDVDLELRTRQATGQIANYDEKVLYDMGMRVSNYNTLSEKVTRGLITSNIVARVPTSQANVHHLRLNIAGNEGFSWDEFTRDGLVLSFQADFANNDWFNTRVKNVVYKQYNNAVSLPNRYPENEFGLLQSPLQLIMTGQDGIPATAISEGSITYRIPSVVARDRYEIQRRAAAFIADGGNVTGELQNLLNYDFPTILDGSYRFKIGFKIPGKNITHYSSNDIVITNPISPD